MTSLGEWLESLGLAQYAEAFREHAIGWDVLSQLDHNLLKDIGVSAVGDRLRILRAVEALWPRDEKSETLVSRVPSSPHPGSVRDPCRGFRAAGLGVRPVGRRPVPGRRPPRRGRVPPRGRR